MDIVGFAPLNSPGFGPTSWGRTQLLMATLDGGKSTQHFLTSRRWKAFEKFSTYPLGPVEEVMVQWSSPRETTSAEHQPKTTSSFGAGRRIPVRKLSIMCSASHKINAIFIALDFIPTMSGEVDWGRGFGWWFLAVFGGHEPEFRWSRFKMVVSDSVGVGLTF